MNFLRRLRGIAGTALTWALGWAGIAAPLFFLLLPNHGLGARISASLHMATYAGLGGAVVGATLATLVAVFERRATFASLRPYRIALWGAVSGAAYATSLTLLSSRVQSIGIVIAGGAVCAVLGGASALLALLMAREADRGTKRNSDSDLAGDTTVISPRGPSALGTGPIDGVVRPPKARVKGLQSPLLAHAT